MKAMTIKEIAGLCEVSESAGRSWIAKTAESAGLSAKTANSQGKGPARFTLEETLAIIRAGGKNTLADLLQENAARHKGIASATRLPNGAQLHEIYRLFHEKALTPAHAQRLLGVAELRQAEPAEPPATIEQAPAGTAETDTRQGRQKP